MALRPGKLTELANGNAVYGQVEIVSALCMRHVSILGSRFGVLADECKSVERLIQRQRPRTNTPAAEVLCARIKPIDIDSTGTVPIRYQYFRSAALEESIYGSVYL